MGKRKKNRGYDWRKDTQREEMWKILNPLGIVLNIFCIIVAFLVIGKGGIWFLVDVLLFLVGMGLYFQFPQYFSILDKKSLEKAGMKAKVKHLEIALMSSALCLVLGHWKVPLTVLNGYILVLEIVVLTAVFVAVFYFCSPEVRESWDALFVAVLIAVMFSWGVLQQGNHYLNRDIPEPESYTIVEKKFSNGRKRRDTYEFVIETAPGETIRLSVTGADYQNWEVGDEVPVCIDTGIFGIEYAYIPET